MPSSSNGSRPVSVPPGQPIQTPSLARITGSIARDQAAGGAPPLRLAVGPA